MVSLPVFTIFLYGTRYGNRCAMLYYQQFFNCRAPYTSIVVCVPPLRSALMLNQAMFHESPCMPTTFKASVVGRAVARPFLVSGLGFRSVFKLHFFANLHEPLEGSGDETNVYSAYSLSNRRAMHPCQAEE